MAEWKAISDFPNYEVSDDGRVRSLGGWRKFGNREKLVAGIELKQRLRSGYPSVKLSNFDVAKDKSVHRLVAAAFVPNPDNLPEVNHLHEDGDKTRNLVSNLEWTTDQGNTLHSRRVLKRCIGESHGKSVLTASMVREIRASSESHNALAARLSISRGAVRSVRKGRTWAHLP